MGELSLICVLQYTVDIINGESRMLNLHLSASDTVAIAVSRLEREKEREKGKRGTRQNLITFRKR